MESEPPNPAQSGTDWSLEEVAAVVTDYFAMFADEVAGRPYNKREHNRALQAVTGRSAGSIEFKHQNISAVLAELGLPWLRGYRPRFNYQDALVAEIEGHLAGIPDLDAAPASPPIAVPTLFVPPPARQNTYNRLRPHSSLGYRPPAPVSFPDLAFRLPMATTMQ